MARIKKICPVCNVAFETYPSVNKNSCSMSCGRKLQWSNPLFVKHMSDVHKGKSNWTGKRHTPESIEKMRKTKYQGEEIVIRGNGYEYMYAPLHKRSINGRVPLQIILMESHIGRSLNDDEIVHHIDGNKRNNWINNLMLCTKKEHKKLHASINQFGIKIQSHNPRDKKTGRYLKPDEIKIGGIVRALKSKCKIDGIQVYQE